MNAIVKSQTQSMTSLEISELVEKRHDNVKRTIETLVNHGVITSPQIEEKPTAGRPSVFFVFTGEQGKRDSIIVVAQLCPEFTARLVDRWQELEAQVVQPIFDISNPYHLLQAIETQAKQNIELTQKVEKLEPKAQALDVLSQNKNGYLCLTDVAKHLHIKRSDLTNFMANLKLIYRRATSSITRKGKWAAYERAIKNGWLFHDYVAGEKPDGTDYAPQVLVTPKGLAYIAELITKELKVAS
ncbi:MAG: phage antirepressor KilAC domain-containing protein [Acinetobacter sp.]|jgi:phage regulator Rha-like protein|uniref:phage antirepressor KilAC domain-containing protein n=1 Tax=Acinetobacter sp. TaxID=472 RepID=UPI0028478C84|nr:phage antirepressor KilAC domain-containing protein [Acinetobacter sp.]MDR3027236.1 phage antirepressor KilAC domain-containing protein [Acinetobacter sp.]